MKKSDIIELIKKLGESSENIEFAYASNGNLLDLELCDACMYYKEPTIVFKLRIPTVDELISKLKNDCKRKDLKIAAYNPDTCEYYKFANVDVTTNGNYVLEMESVEKGEV